MVHLGHTILELLSLFVIAGIFKYTLNLAEKRRKDLEKANLVLEAQRKNLTNIVEERVKDLSIKSQELERTVSELEKSKIAMLNMMEDITSSKDELGKKVKELSALNKISQAITEFTKPEKALKFLLEIIAKLLNSNKSVITLWDEKQKMLIGLKPAFGFSDKEVSQIKLNLDSSVGGIIFKKEKPIVVEDVDKDKRVNQKIAKSLGIKNLLGALLEVGEKRLGVLYVCNKKQEKFDKEDIKMITTVASQMAVIIDNLIKYRQISEDRSKTQAILEGIEDGVYAIDKDKKIILFNKATEVITGIKKEKALGQDSCQLICLKKKKKMTDKCISKCPVDQVLKTGKSLNFPRDFYITSKKGKKIPISYNISPIKDSKNKIIGAIAVLRDITEEKRAENMRVMFEASLELEKTRKEFVSLVSHELRTPMTGIKGWISMILEGDAGKINPQVKQYLEEAYKNNERLLKLIEDILNVSRIEQGRLSLNPAKMDISTAIKEVITTLEIEARNQGLYLKYEESKQKLPLVWVDSDKVKEVLMNLLGNGLKFTEKGGITVRNEIRGNKILTYVSDTGIGISKESLPHIFEKFFRAGGIQQVSGTGLGLFITKGMVENMGGDIWVESQEGKGSVFSFSLPIYKSGIEKILEQKDHNKK